jgi:hypothetical protein
LHVKLQQKYKPLGKLSFDPQNLAWLINIFLPTAIATHPERSVDRGTRGDPIGFGLRDLMSVNKIAGDVVEVILAGCHPAVGAISHTGYLPTPTHYGLGGQIG